MVIGRAEIPVAKALTEKKGFIAALKALRHPKASPHRVWLLWHD
jgi:hypothetical protein